MGEMVDLKGKKVGIALGVIGIILHNLVLLNIFDFDLLSPVVLAFILSYAVISTYLLFKVVEYGKKTDPKIRKGFVVSFGTAIVTSILLAYTSLGYDHAEIMILMVAFVSSLWITISVYLIALGRSGAKGKNPERKAGVLLIVSPFILGAVALFLLFFSKSPMGYLLRSESSLNLLGSYFYLLFHTVWLVLIIAGIVYAVKKISKIAIVPVFALIITLIIMVSLSPSAYLFFDGCRFPDNGLNCRDYSVTYDSLELSLRNDGDRDVYIKNITSSQHSYLNDSKLPCSLAVSERNNLLVKGQEKAYTLNVSNETGKNCVYPIGNDTLYSILAEYSFASNTSNTAINITEGYAVT